MEHIDNEGIVMNLEEGINNSLDSIDRSLILLNKTLQALIDTLKPNCIITMPEEMITTTG